MYLETTTISAPAAAPAPRLVAGLDALARMISYRRPAGSRTESNFIKKWLLPLGLKQDDYGNLYIRIGETNVMWSSHTDTVHRTTGIQNVVCAKGLVKLAKSERESNCLGADCTAGVWLMREMILAGKPGLYIFHREEEIGGHGSRHIADKRNDLLEGIQIAIAFDRKGTTSVITHQFGRCCSDLFASQLAGLLGGGFTLDDGGIFTDTANYTHLIPECTNISVGMEHCHSPKETLDMEFLLDLRERLINLDTNLLIVSRNPLIDTDDPHPLDWNKDDRDWLSDIRSGRTVDLDRASRMGMSDIVREFPDEVADFLECYGVDEEQLVKHVEHSLGLRRRYGGK
ncbi:hypothetical protein [Bradyrhizobium erythrophlei]|uniref:Peptidase family M28 n=1 Tax=Bradyrhizobium erythrophlei TaxID=1437360 RepID=A0A1M5NG16_9BRAD|nr:hypothetical protein [Bradyrhizobium erythrophlei]SHG88504.1 hypothetical protein SAMN05443248_2983 [Bradyrhizobium erythrophlei]